MEIKNIRGIGMAGVEAAGDPDVLRHRDDVIDCAGPVRVRCRVAAGEKKPLHNFGMVIKRKSLIKVDHAMPSDVLLPTDTVLREVPMNIAHLIPEVQEFVPKVCAQK